MDLNKEAKELRIVATLFNRIRLWASGVHRGFWKLVKETRKYRLKSTFHSNRIQSSGIRSKEDLVFVAENIAKNNFCEMPSSKTTLNLLTAFETVLNLDIKNIDWFMGDLCFLFPDFNCQNISLDPEKKQSSRIHEIYLRKKIEAGFKELSKTESLEEQEFSGIAASFLFLVITADYTLPDTTQGKLYHLLRTWI